MQPLTGHRVGLLSVSILLGCLAPFAASAMRAASGSYVGNNTDNRSITGLGFQPDAILVKADEEEEGFLRFSAMSGDESGSLSDKQYKTNRIQALETDGFQVGTADEVNESGTTYYWFAWQNTSVTSTTLRYTGNNTDNRSITGVGFAPDAAFVKGDVNENAHMRLSSMSGDRAVDFLESGEVSNRIQALEIDGFQVGTHHAVNQQNKTYDAAALKTETNSFAVGSYTGDGTDNRAITNVGFQPDVVLIKGDASTAGVFRSTAHSGDAASVLSQSVAANMIQRFASTGFEVGTNATVNQNGTMYHWMAWRNLPPDITPPAAPTVVPPTSPVNAGTQTITGTAEANALVRITGGVAPASQQLSGGAIAFSIAVPLLQDATNTLTVTARDTAGNESTGTSVTIVEDSTSPNRPTATPTGGTYASSQSVTLSAETGATIHYTTNGSTPTATSAAYTSALAISATTTLKATATDTAGNTSGVMTETYTISTPSPGTTTSGTATTESSSADEDSSARGRGKKEKSKKSTKVTGPVTLLLPPPIPSAPEEGLLPLPAAIPILEPSPSLETPTALSPIPTSAPVPRPALPRATPRTVGRVAALFTSNLLRVAPVTEAAPSGMQTVSRVLRSVDSVLLTGYVGGIPLTAAMLFNIGAFARQHAKTRKTGSLIPILPIPDYGVHFAQAAPVDRRTGTIPISFHQWKRLHALKDRCLYTLFFITTGKIGLAGLATFLLYQWLAP